MGVHNADLQLYMAGSIERLYGQVRWREAADAPDVLMATLEFEGGAIGQWICDRAAQGPGLRQFSVVGSNGRIDLPGVRSGRPLHVHVGTDPEPISDDDVLAMVPAFHLDDRTARFFGGDRLARYDNGDSKADLKLIAIEMAELLDAIDTGGVLEVDAETGLTAVGLVMAVYESSDAGRPVAMSEVLDGSLSVYQGEAGRALGRCG
jgi:predicted dehydrogenase